MMTHINMGQGESQIGYISSVPRFPVGGMARSAIDKAKGVKTTLEEAGNRTAEISKEGTP
jgi:hypothetical protein